MSMKRDFIDRKVTDLCGPDGRLAAPLRMSEAAQVAEIRALGETIERLAPASNYEGWWAQFEAVLLGRLKARVWPTLREIGEAAASIPKPRAVAMAGDEILDWREDGKRRQLKAWAFAGGAVPPSFVTYGRCRAIGMTHDDAERAVASAADPYNWGIDPDLTREVREASRVRYAGSAGAAA